MKLNLYFAILLLITTSVSSYSQNDTKKQIPLDPNLHHGKLKNGLTYYIEKTTDENVEFRLIVKVGKGIATQDEDLLGIAHLLEHVIAAGGTTHFPETINSFRNGHGLTAYTAAINTGTYYTTYMFSLPKTRLEGLLEKSLLLLREMAKDSLVEENLKNEHIINRERETVLTEFRAYKSQKDKNRNQKAYKIAGSPKGHPLYDPFYVNGEKHDSNINTFPITDLQKFYKDWYRPELQGVMVVGDVDVNEIENQIKTLFSDLKNPENYPKLDVQEMQRRMRIKLTGENQWIVLEDSMQQNLKVELLLKRPNTGRKSIGDYKKRLLEELYQNMASTRFKELSQQYKSPFLKINHWIEETTGSINTQLSAIATIFEVSDISAIKSGIETAATELERIRQYGFTAAEFEKAKQQLNSRSIIQESSGKLVRHFVFGDPIPSKEFLERTVDSLVQSLSLNEMNRTIKEWIDLDENIAVVCTLPNIKEEGIPSKDEISQWISDVKKEAIEPYEIKKKRTVLMSPDKIQKFSNKVPYQITKKDSWGVTKLRLENGMEIFLKPMKPGRSFLSLPNKIYIKGSREGGALDFGKDDYFTALQSTSIVRNSGIGGLDKFEIADILKSTGTDMGSGPVITTNEVSFSGTAAIDHIETLLQLVYLYFMEPNISTEAFEDWKLSMERNLKSTTRDPERLFREHVNALQNTVQVPEFSEEDLNGISQDRALEAYHATFDGASGFKFALAGDFNQEELIPIVVRYLGNIPSHASQGKKPDVKPLSFERNLNSGNQRKFIIPIPERRANDLPVLLSYDGNYRPDEENHLKLMILERALRGILWARIHGKEGVYHGIGTRIAYETSDLKEGTYRMAFQFKSHMGRTKHLLDAVNDELEKVKSIGVDKTFCQGAIAEVRDKLQSDLENNFFWSLNLIGDTEKIEETQKQLRLIDDITLGDINSFAREVIPEQDDFNLFLAVPQNMDTQSGSINPLFSTK